MNRTAIRAKDKEGYMVEATEKAPAIPSFF